MYSYQSINQPNQSINQLSNQSISANKDTLHDFQS